MKTFRTTICVSILSILITVSAAYAADTQKNGEAQVVANQAIAQLAGLQTKAARKTLQSKKNKFGSTSEFNTAWALLEAIEAVESGSDAAAASGKSLSQIAKANKADYIATFWEAELLYLQSKNQQALSGWQAAAAQAEKAVKDDIADATAQFYYGAALVRQKKYEPALKALRLAVRGGFDEAMVNQQIGFIFLFQQKWKDAKNAFDVGLSVNPRFAPMYYWRGMTWDKLGRKDNMLLDLDQYVKLAPNGPEAGKARAVLKSAGG